MRMIGELIESKASLLDAEAEESLIFYTDKWIELNWTVDPIFDNRQYYVLPQHPSRMYLKNTGIFAYSYSVNSFIAANSKKYGSVEVAIFLNGVEQKRTTSYSTVKHKDVGNVSNSKASRIKITGKDSYLQIKVRRTKKYTGAVRIEPDETIFNIKRERPL